MIYECEACKTALPAGVLACPKCGEGFDEPVPQDAEVSKRGWQAKIEPVISPSAIAQPTVPTSASPEQPGSYPDYILPGERFSTTSSQAVQEPAANSSSGLQRFLAYAGVTALVFGIATVIYYMNFFSVTVTTPQLSILGQSVGGDEVNNVGLIADRQNGLIVGISVAMLGAILLVAGIFADIRNGARNLGVGSLAVYAIVLSGLIGIGVYGVREVTHQQVIKAEDRQAQKNLKMIGLGIIEFNQDHDENFPPMSDSSTLQNALKPYIANEQSFVNPATSKDFVPNSKCSGITLASIADPSSLVVMYDEVPESDGSRWLLYSDGHIRRKNPAEWASILANQKPNKAYDPADTSYGSNDTLIPSIISASPISSMSLPQLPANASPSQNKIPPYVPGKSLDKILIGQTREALVATTGKFNNNIAILYKQGKITQIEFSVAKDGPKLPSFNELISRDRNLVKTCYGIDTYDDNGQPTGGYVQFYYDDVQQGIAYGIDLQDNFILTYSPHSIIIHAPNVPADVDASNAKVRIITGTEAMSYQTKAEADKADSALMH